MEEEPKQETHICKYCKAETSQSDDECYAKPKQETLEEAALSIIPDRSTAGWIDSFGATERIGFIKGAKWMQEKMYSEEDMIDFAFDTYCYISELMGVPFNLISENRTNVEEWFKNFKKK